MSKYVQLALTSHCQYFNIYFFLVYSFRSTRSIRIYVSMYVCNAIILNLQIDWLQWRSIIIIIIIIIIIWASSIDVVSTQMSSSSLVETTCIPCSFYTHAQFIQSLVGNVHPNRWCSLFISYIGSNMPNNKQHTHTHKQALLARPHKLTLPYHIGNVQIKQTKKSVCRWKGTAVISLNDDLYHCEATLLDYVLSLSLSHSLIHPFSW